MKRTNKPIVVFFGRFDIHLTSTWTLKRTVSHFVLADDFLISCHSSIYLICKVRSLNEKSIKAACHSTQFLPICPNCFVSPALQISFWIRVALIQIFLTQYSMAAVLRRSGRDLWQFDNIVISEIWDLLAFLPGLTWAYWIPPLLTAISFAAEL